LRCKLQEKLPRVTWPLGPREVRHDVNGGRQMAMITSDDFEF